MHGVFHINCICRASGETTIGPQTVSAPWHLSKPYWDGHVLLIHAVNATAGIFAGDHLEMRVGVESGASVLLTSPSASRIHTMPHGEATLQQHIRVADDAWLEWMPELFIPQRECRYRQITAIELAPRARAYVVESIAPGRVAHGESFAFSSLNWSTRINLGGTLVFSERYELAPDNGSLIDLQTALATRYTATAYVIHPGELPFRDWQQTVMAWQDGSLFIGGTQPADGFYLFRVVADSSERLKETLSRLRALVAEKIPELRQSARKL
jgi:urease accessory protein